MLYMYDYIYNSCNDKVKCNLQLPPYQAIDGTTAVCKRRFPNVESFRFRGVFLDIGCGFGKNYAFINKLPSYLSVVNLFTVYEVKLMTILGAIMALNPVRR